MTQVRRCICPGSYDPVTLGHVDIVERASRLYDEVVVGVLFNPAKADSGMFTIDERTRLLRESLGHLPNVVVDAYGDGLLVDLCTRLEVSAIVKGLRSGTDFAYELPMALMNTHLTGIETVFLPGNPAFEHVSSSLVKEVWRLGGYGLDLVPEPVAAALRARTP
ncbi:pantetheine-phosphate adenylyltransferase [Arsenicicoccus sp. oral taxon 190]|uniref:pantetheine-phosphate adenylyltransferase n=1 Tax=Arsenicicoccus sp. oral taxon 190 TaxID=1658671 RepID=UPI00067A025F|nr:pantetheine-phosphate adenylyltransferase [Arsenicicoccus sp. oral taxon 190]AKT52265.1 phosphopantetheine adenylyltransferase [Arsenicicoccus sp. oral taxon 190]